MSEGTNYNNNNPNSDFINKVNVLDYFLLLLKWKKLILWNFVIITGFSIGISFLLPRWYKSVASIMPPKEQGVLNGMGIASSVLKSIPGLQRLGGSSQNSNLYNYIAILRSRSSMEQVVKKFDLVHVYEISDGSLEKAVKELRDNTMFEIQDEGYISLEVFDQDAKRAADITNYFITVLNSMSIQMTTQEAKSSREFIERRLEKNKTELFNAEESLRTYQERTGTLFVPEQTSNSVAVVAELYGMKVQKEIAVGILEQTFSKDNLHLQQAKTELHELNKRLAGIPQIGFESIRLYRDAVIQQKIYEYLVPIFEQAKIDEQKNVPVLIVLDEAIPAEKPIKPSKRIVVLIGVVISLLLPFLIILFREHFTSVKETSPETWQKLQMATRVFNKK
ncbi:MAG: hypothetical protein HY960_07965 [Ignavibacteriae bacterium]|nr:hypothetical protein [Ignavibacteriota bacterium]